MAPLPKAAAHHRARIASLSRDRAHNDPELLDERRKYWTERTANYIENVLAQAPPLSDEQRTRLAELLRPVRQPIHDHHKAAVAEAELTTGASPPTPRAAKTPGGSTKTASAASTGKVRKAAVAERIAELAGGGDDAA